MKSTTYLKKFIHKIFAVSAIFFFFFSVLYALSRKISLYGSMISWQFFPSTASIVKQFSDKLYPFYSFEFSSGFDSLADSQLGVLHPLKLILLLFSISPFEIEQIYLSFHWLLLLFASYCFAAHIIKDEEALGPKKLHQVFLAINIGFSLAIYTNFCHPFFIAALAYGVLLLLISDQFLDCPSRTGFISLSITTALMLLVGNFAIQWLMLLLVVVYSISACLIKNKSIKPLIWLGMALALGLVIASPQTLPTFELMRASARGVAGGLDKFQQSPGPYQWFGYITPGSSYLLWKYAPEIYTYFADSNVVEGVHFIGIVPLALCLSLGFSKNTIPKKFLPLIVCLVFFALRGLGVFSPVNIFLNYLPIFGQFRIPVRSFFCIDFLLCVLALLVLARFLDRQCLEKSFKWLMGISILLSFFTILLVLFRVVSANQDFPDVSFGEVGYMLLGTLVAAAGIALCKSTPIRGSRLVLALVFLSFVDLTLHIAGAPRHWRVEQKSTLQSRAASVDNLCREAKITKLFVISGVWPKFDVPLFPIGRGVGNNYETIDQTTPELNGLNCTLTYALNTSTLTPGSTLQLLGWISTRPTKQEILEGVKVLGFDVVGAYTDSTGVGEVAEEIKLIKLPDISQSTVNALSAFAASYPPVDLQEGARIAAYVYDSLKWLRLEKLMPYESRKVLTDSLGRKLVVLKSPYSFVLLNGMDVIMPVESRGQVVILPDKSPPLIDVVYVPVALLFGITASVFGVVLLAFGVFRFDRLYAGSDFFGKSLGIKVPFESLKKIYGKFSGIYLIVLAVTAAILAARVLSSGQAVYVSASGILCIFVFVGVVFVVSRAFVTRVTSLYFAATVATFYLFGLNYLS